MNKEKMAIITVDLGFGDTGKGSIVDSLVRKFTAHTVIRYNGGPQAAHNVTTPDGRRHTFSQFGSGTFVPGVKTYLSRFVPVHPSAMENEEAHLKSSGVSDAYDRLAIDKRAPVITPFHQAANRLKELARGDARLGTCGLGVSEAIADWQKWGEKTLLVGDLSSQQTTYDKLLQIKMVKLDQLQGWLKNLPGNEQAKKELMVFANPDLVTDYTRFYHDWSSKVAVVGDDCLAAIVRQPGTIIAEAGQGVLLDPVYGFRPYVTSASTTLENIDALLATTGYDGQTVKLGLSRAYATRHGPGPFVSEDSTLGRDLEEFDNKNNLWQGPFRVGHLDLVSLRYAQQVAGQLNCLAVSHLDRLKIIPEWKICVAYQHVGRESGLSEFFIINDGKIVGIKAKPDPDQSHQEKLTKLLFHCRPIYRTIEDGIILPKRSDDLLAIVERSLNIPVALTSHGPTADDKHYRSFWQ